jgi:hypothetical protein
MGRQYTRKHKGGESQQDILGRLTEDAVKITKDIEALRNSLKLEVPINEEIVEEKEDDNMYEGLSDMFSMKDFVQKSEQAKKVNEAKKTLDTTELILPKKKKDANDSDIWRGNRTQLIDIIRHKIQTNNNAKGNIKPSNDKYHKAIREIEEATTVDKIKEAFTKNTIELGVNGQVKGGKTKKLQKKSKKTQRKSHRK